MTLKSDNSINGRYFFRWDTEEGQKALKIANDAIAKSGMGLQIHYEMGMAAGLIGDFTDQHKEIMGTHDAGIQQAAEADSAEQQRQKQVQDVIAAAEKRAANNGN